jgi:hypothetical protein
VVRALAIAAIALGAAFCYAASNVVEQRKAALAPAETSMRIGLLWHLAHEPMWWLGICVDLGGFGLQALALGFGTLAFVQPLLVTSLLFSLVLGQSIGAHRLTRHELRWAGLLVISLSVFLVVASPSGGFDERPFKLWVEPLIAVAGLVGACLLLATRASPNVRATLLAAAAGTTFGVSSTLMKSFSHELGADGVIGMLHHWEPYALGLIVATGFLMVQSAFQAGDLRSALPPLEAAEPIVASVLGVVLMRERLHAHGPIAKATLAVCAVAMLWSVILLAQAASEARAAQATDDPG